MPGPYAISRAFTLQESCVLLSAVHCVVTLSAGGAKVRRSCTLHDLDHTRCRATILPIYRSFINPVLLGIRTELEVGVFTGARVLPG